MPELPKINKSWSLFLDRDGVINHEKELDYIYNYAEFEFYPGALNALRILAEKFGRIFIVTNQRGVEKELMTESALIQLHQEMRKDIEKNGGRIDAIYYCTSLDNAHPNRKPQAGMAIAARDSFPEIDFSKSIMVGNNISDMLFGRNAGMQTVLVLTTSPDQSLPHPVVDYDFADLAAFATEIENN
ncbi:MAG: HAD-IIIA family hydrolase [Chitinophagaceae bacterium]